MRGTKSPGFTGINNRAPTDRLPRDDKKRAAVRDAVNVDLTGEHSFQRRPGFDRVIPGTNCRDLFSASPFLAYFADGAQLLSFDGAATAEIAPLASPYASVAYVRTPRGVAWSDGFSNNLVVGTSSVRLTPPLPSPEPVVGVSGAGSLRAGSYGVSFVSVRPDGQQSAMTIPVFVDVPANGAIQVTCPIYAERIAVFITAQNGDMFYRESYIEPGQTSAAFPVVASAGQPKVFELLAALPPGGVIALHNGRLLTADGSFVYYSLPYAYGLYRPASDYVPMGDEVTLIAAVVDGVYIATTKETRYFPGGDIADARSAVVLPFGALRGTLTPVPESTDVMWFSPRGPIRARSDGTVIATQDEQIAFEPMTRGAGLYREQQGMRQFIAALSGSSGASGAVFGSYMDAEVITRGT